MTINDLKTGDFATVAHLDLLSGSAVRLLDLGFVPGTRVRLLSRAPLGEPLLVELRQHTLMLRKSEAAAIEILPEENK